MGNGKVQGVPLNWPITHMLVERLFGCQQHIMLSKNGYKPLQKQKLLVTHWLLAFMVSCLVSQLVLTSCKCSWQIEILLENDMAFHCRLFRDFLNELGIHLFCYAYVPLSNGIIEWCHQNMKMIVTRKPYSIMEVVYWYVTPKIFCCWLSDMMYCY